jgi:NAD(P)-dependent dehydrogenase (short-subunit alcohol dehydrogenase family)
VKFITAMTKRNEILGGYRMRLEGKVALITGAGAGIGRACAELFAEQGARVVIAERDDETGRAAQDVLSQKGYDSLFVKTDVSDPTSVKKVVDEAISKYGQIDILYNNAGGSSMSDGPVTTTPFDEFWNKMKVDLFGTWLGCHYVIPHMIAAGGGSIINATSVLALIGTPGRDAYTAAKGGIIALTRSMAVEFAPHKIRVNAVAPGATTTERVLKRIAQPGSGASKTAGSSPLGLIEPREIANAVLFLGSDESLKMTGQVMVVDSGLTIS